VAYPAAAKARPTSPAASTRMRPNAAAGKHSWTRTQPDHGLRPGKLFRQACWADWNRGEFRSIPRGASSMLPLANVGSGKFGTPCARMQAEYFNARVCA
jgi:hypothetical protein